MPAIPFDIPAHVQRAVIEAGWEVIPRRGRASQRTSLIVRECPECIEVNHEDVRLRPNTAHVTHAGRLWCGEGLPACAAKRGLEYEEWAPRYSPRAFADSRSEEAAPVPFEDASREIERLTEEAAAWASEKDGRVAVLDISPPGIGKSRAVLTHLANEGRGTFLSPRHTLTREHLGTFTEQLDGGEGRYYAGVLRRMGDHPWRRNLEAMARHGWSPRRILKAAGVERPASSEGPSDAPRFGVHQHVIALQDLSVEDGEPALQTPIFLDEQPPLVEPRRVPISQFEFICGEHADPAVHRWCDMHRELAGLVVTLAREAIEERRAKPRSETRYPRVISGNELVRRARVVLGRTQSLSDANEFLRTWMMVTATNAILRGCIPIPFGDARAVLDGTLTPMHVLRGDWYDMLACIARDLYGVVDVPSFTGACALVVSGHGSAVTAEVHVVAPWADAVRADLSFVIVDATARHLRTVLPRAWAGREVRFFSLTAAPATAANTDYLWVPSDSMSRRCLLDSRGRMRPRAIPTLVRALLHSARLVHSRVGEGRLGLLLPKALVPVLEAARDMSADDLDESADATISAREALSRAGSGGAALVDACRYARLVYGVRITQVGAQGATRGTNTFEDCNALLSFPFIPNIGATSLDALALRVPPEELRRGLSRAELEQGHHRVRQVRASDRKVVIQIDRDTNSPGEEFASSPMPDGRPSVARTAVRDAAEAMLDIYGMTSAALLNRLAANPSLCHTLADTWGMGGDTSAERERLYGKIDGLRRVLPFIAAGGVREKTMQRVVSGVAAAVGATQARREIGAETLTVFVKPSDDPAAG